MKNSIRLLFFILCVYIIISSYFINHSFTIKNTEWLFNSPKILNLSSTNISIIFEVAQPAYIYWRIYSNNSIPIISDFTNYNKLNNIIFYGGGVISKKNGSYTNNIQNLQSNYNYTIYFIAIPSIGRFPKKIDSIQFKTLNNYKSH